MVWIDTLAAAAVLPGHCVLWILFGNHNEASSRPLRLRRLLKHISRVFALFIPGWYYGLGGLHLLSGLHSGTPLFAHAVYAAICIGLAIVYVPAGILRRRRVARLAARDVASRRIHDLHGQLVATSGNDAWSRWLLKVPGNQALQLEEVSKNMRLPRLPSELDGLTIAHLSDLHFTGRIPKRFFDHVVDHTNAMDPDLTVITGDILDSNAYASWIPSTLGRLRARYGVYYVLGNHDVHPRIDSDHLRLMMSEAGIDPLGGRWQELTINGAQIILAGNEMPWVPPAPDISDIPPRHADQVRILLAHTPDISAWAQRHDFDLMLAGHTHGGQIALPGIGAVVSPSRGPLEHVVGMIRLSPTLLHVSRGISGETPLRLNCRGELAKLVLRSPQPTEQQTLSDYHQQERTKPLVH